MAEERLCLFHLFGNGSPARQKGMTLESLRKKTKLSTEKLEAAVSRLEQHWFLVEEGVLAGEPSRGDSSPKRAVFPFRECFQALWQTGQELFKSSADRSTSSLEHLLSTFHGDQLRSLANFCHVPTQAGVPAFSGNAFPSISHRIEVQKRLYGALCHPLMAWDLLHRCELWVQEIFLWLCEQGGRVSMPEVRSRLGAPERVFPLVDVQESHALAFDSFSYDGQCWLFIPYDLLAIIQQEAEGQAKDGQRFALCPLSGEKEASEGLPLVLYDLATAVGMSQQNILEVTKEDKLPKRWRNKIRPLLHGRPRLDEREEDLYVDQLFSAARELGVLRCATPAGEEKRRYLPGPMLESWSELSLVGQAQRLLSWWSKPATWRDVRPDGSVVSTSSSTRGQLLEILKQCVPERWYQIDAVLYHLWRRQPLYLYDSYRHTFTKPTFLRSRREQWMKREGAIYVGLLSSTLSEFGIVSVDAIDDDGRPSRFCVTALGGAALAHDQPEGARETPHWPLLIVQPNYDILVMQFEPYLVYPLLSFAQIQRVGMVSEFRLTQQALLSGLAKGVTIEQVMAFLSEQTRTAELPQNVAYTLRDWIKGYREASLEEVILIKLVPEQTEDLLYRVLEDLHIEPCKLAPGIFVVKSAARSFLELRRRLEKEGIVVRGEPTRFPLA